jgi:3-hydroxyisobutyrate dehydrogenase-like beta-hydroxyacid dehydrogenase
MSLKVHLPATDLCGNFAVRLALKLARTDLGLATDLGRTDNVPMRMTTLSKQERIDGMSRGGPELESAIVLTLQEEDALMQVRLPSAELDRA